ncbi:hypothetical protein [Streptomyces atratus]|uniref:hypothetical protein n=1 Tax=Streptomyces atratus TaxID=1893 RepID=UPI0033E7210A
MKKNKVRILATAVVTAAVLAVGAAYLLGAPPFKRTGTTEAGEACKNLGSPEKVIPAIREIAPPKPDYSFIEQENQGLDTYFSGCSVRAEEVDFLVTRTEFTMLGNSTFDTWVNGPASKMVDTEDPKNFERFGTDTWGVASKSKAAVVVPCFPKGEQSLTTVVLLRDSAEPDRAKDRYRQELIDIVSSSAAFAHKDAGCTIPFKMD